MELIPTLFIIGQHQKPAFIKLYFPAIFQNITDMFTFFVKYIRLHYPFEALYAIAHKGL